MIAIDLSIQATDADPEAIQQISYTGSLCGNNHRLIFSIFNEWKGFS